MDLRKVSNCEEPLLRRIPIAKSLYREESLSRRVSIAKNLHREESRLREAINYEEYSQRKEFEL